jgi:hypothetical protein
MTVIIILVVLLVISTIVLVLDKVSWEIPRIKTETQRGGLLEPINRETDLVSFGNYLFSKEREKLLAEVADIELSVEERRATVTDADLENWKNLCITQK